MIPNILNPGFNIFFLGNIEDLVKVTEGYVWAIGIFSGFLGLCMTYIIGICLWNTLKLAISSSPLRGKARIYLVIFLGLLTNVILFVALNWEGKRIVFKNWSSYVWGVSALLCIIPGFFSVPFLGEDLYEQWKKERSEP